MSLKQGLFMTNEKRLVLIKTNKNFINCKCCGFTYMPFSIEASKKCPKCDGLKVDDETYLNNEVQEIEQVNQDYLFDNQPRFY